ncbi:MAG: prepilin-type N-terminal cleavage/methylation domain-containing protein [Pseudomonadota bacterium]
MFGVNNKKDGWPVTAKFCRGYTLVELLLAIFIFSLVVASVYGAYKVTFSVVHDSEHQALVADRSGFVLTRLTEDLESLILGKGAFLLGEEQSYAGARKDGLSFLSSAQVFLGKTDMPRGRLLISYLAEIDDRSGLLSLYRSETEVLPGIKIGEGMTQKHLLCSGLKELKLTYRDKTGNEVTTWKSDGNTAEDSQESTKLPLMVGVEMVFPEAAVGQKVQVFRTSIALPQPAGS